MCGTAFGDQPGLNRVPGFIIDGMDYGVSNVNKHVYSGESRQADKYIYLMGKCAKAGRWIRRYKRCWFWRNAADKLRNVPDRVTSSGLEVCPGLASDVHSGTFREV